MAVPEATGDRIVVVTGGARGLGLETGRRFAQAGAGVVLADVDAGAGEEAAEALRQEGLRAEFTTLDVRDPDQCDALVDRLITDFSVIDVWVNNAGVAHKAAAEVLPREQWRETIDVMLSGAFYCSQAVARPMLANHPGSSGVGVRRH